MCGRFASSKSGDELQQELGLRVIRSRPVPSFNIAPTRPVPVVINDGAKALDVFRWGLIPWWAKDPRIGAKSINARGESLTEKATFKDAFRLHRCLVLADGFYEWKADGGRRVPYFIRMKSGRSMIFAGLWDRWRSPDRVEVLSCAIITTTPNSVIQAIHDRMPVILGPDAIDRWLDPQPREGADLQGLLVPCAADWLEAYTVSDRVNKPDNDGPENVQPAQPPRPAQGELF
jgi:putative SOS response-associated peptidase YedK